MVFKFKPLGYFQTSVVLVEPRSLVRLSCLHLVYGPHEGAIERTRPWESLVAQIATGPWCLLKVRLCSPLQLVTLLYRCVFRLLPTPSSSTSQNPSCTNLFGKFSVHISISLHILILEYWSIGVLRGGVGWGLGMMFARQGDTSQNVKILLPPFHRPSCSGIRDCARCDRHCHSGQRSWGTSPTG